MLKAEAMNVFELSLRLFFIKVEPESKPSSRFVRDPSSPVDNELSYKDEGSPFSSPKVHSVFI